MRQISDGVDGRPVRTVGALLVTLASGMLMACSTGGPAGAGDGSSQPVIRVFAAASLTDAFDELAVAFEADDPRFEVELNLAGSSSLRAQILDGAPADVFAPASVDVMDDVVAADAATGPLAFATNRLKIAVPSGNPANLNGIEDFARPELLLGLCAEPVPCGTLADAALAAAGVVPAIDTREPDVRALANKVALGELDAGIVYATDVLALSSELDGIELSDELDGTEPSDRSAPEALYPIARLTGADNPEGAAAFIAFVTSSRGRQILARYGFGTP